jgi:hypothetical protein
VTASGPEPVVREWFASLAAGEPDLKLCHPEIEIRNWDEAPIRGPYHGHDGVRQWWADFTDAFDEGVRMDLKELVPLDDSRVVTEQHIVGRFRLTGIEVDGPFGSITTVADEMVRSAIGYASFGRARRAAGLPKD